MEPKDYEVLKIEGEYATLVPVSGGDELFIALHLLPEGTDVGSKIHWEMMEYHLL